MRTGWQIKTLGEICNIARGGSPRPIQDFLTNDADGINWIKISDATASGKYIYHTQEKIRPEGVKRSRRVHEGDFLLSNSMSFGRPYILKTSGCIHDGWLVLSDKSGLFDQEYLYYFLGSDAAYSQFNNLAAGSTVRNLNTELVKRVAVVLPPLSEQRSIVATLDEAFETIATATLSAEKNLVNARDIFGSRLQAAFSRLTTTYHTSRLAELSKIQYGYTEKASIEKIGPKFLRITDIQDGCVNWDRVPYCKIDAADHAKHKLESGDIVFARTGATTGKSFVISNPPDAVCASYLIKLRPNTLLLRPEFLGLFFQTRGYWDQVNRGMSGSAQGGFNASKLGEMEVPTPPLADQDSVIAELRVIEEYLVELSEIYKRKLSALVDLKRSLLQMAFAGRLGSSSTDVLGAVAE